MDKDKEEIATLIENLFKLIEDLNQRLIKLEEKDG